jgi:hypothetical protein
VHFRNEKLKNEAISFAMYVWLYAYNNLRAYEMIFMKFDIVLCRNSSHIPVSFI